MYRLTARMKQRFQSDLKRYHDLFNGGRCQGWELEELIVRAISSDTVAQHLPVWKEAGHDDKADIIIKTNGHKYPVNIKSGQLKNEFLVLSGHRLGRFEGCLQDITNYLNSSGANLISVPYRKVDDKEGQHHCYQLGYVSVESLQDIVSSEWQEKGRQHIQENKFGVEISLRPSMSWQVWWKIPVSLVHFEDEFCL